MPRSQVTTGWDTLEAVLACGQELWPHFRPPVGFPIFVRSTLPAACWRVLHTHLYLSLIWLELPMSHVFFKWVDGCDAVSVLGSGGCIGAGRGGPRPSFPQHALPGQPDGKSQARGRLWTSSQVYRALGLPGVWPPLMEPTDLTGPDLASRFSSV